MQGRAQYAERHPELRTIAAVPAQINRRSLKAAPVQFMPEDQ
jgi:hypothetical protein